MTDPWPPPTELVGMRNSFAPELSPSALRGQVRPGYGGVIFFGILLAFAWTEGTWLDRPLTALVFLLVIWGSLRRRAQITIIDGMVKLEVRRLWGATIRVEEPLVNYATLRHRLVPICSVEAISSSHVLELVHATKQERSVPVFWTTDFTQVTAWQTRLATALGVATYEIASGGTKPISPSDVEKPLAEKSAEESCLPPPPELQVARTANGSVITLPKPPHIDRRGLKIAITILALPALTTILLLLPSGIPVLLMLAISTPLMWWLIKATGEMGAPLPLPRPVTRLVLTPRGMGIAYRNLIPGRYRASVPWEKVYGVEIGPDMGGRGEVMTIRTAAACFIVTGSHATLDWLRAAIITAAQSSRPH